MTYDESKTKQNKKWGIFIFWYYNKNVVKSEPFFYITFLNQLLKKLQPEVTYFL